MSVPRKLDETETSDIYNVSAMFLGHQTAQSYQSSIKHRSMSDSVTRYIRLYLPTRTRISLLDNSTVSVGYYRKLETILEGITSYTSYGALPNITRTEHVWMKLPSIGDLVATNTLVTAFVDEVPEP